MAGHLSSPDNYVFLRQTVYHGLYGNVWIGGLPKVARVEASDPSTLDKFSPHKQALRLDKQEHDFL